MNTKSLSLSCIKKLDKSRLLDTLMDFPEQCAAALDLACKAHILFDKRDFNKVVFAGMGGSGIGADLVRSLLYFDITVPVCVYREYELPACVDTHSLVFIASYSGDTEETLSAYKIARQRGASVICISSGGLLQAFSRKDENTFVLIPPGIPPRSAFGYMGIIPLVLLSRLGLIGQVDADIRQAVGVLTELRDKSLAPRIAQKDNAAKTLAANIKGRLTLVYAPSMHFDVAATRLRCQLNENAKALAFSGLFPEATHNEIMGWQNPGKALQQFCVVMLRDNKMHPRVAKRMDVSADIIRRDGVRVIDVWSRGEGLLSRILSLTYIGDFASFYLSMLYGVDPAPVDRITFLKSELART